jgi:hypothetical protein
MLKAYVIGWDERLGGGYDYRFTADPGNAASWGREDAESHCQDLNRQEITLHSDEGETYIFKGFKVEQQAEKFVIFCDKQRISS